MRTRGLLLVLSLASLAVGPAVAGSYSADAVAPSEVLTAVREIGLDPTMQPLRRGPYYALHAVDPDGIELRVVADAQLGDILSLRPTRPLIDFTPYYVRAARIISVPANGDAAVEPASGDELRDSFLPRVLRIPEDLPADEKPAPKAK